jgi:hypothetical protein
MRHLISPLPPTANALPVNSRRLEYRIHDTEAPLPWADFSGDELLFAQGKPKTVQTVLFNLSPRRI